jgi:hypothetical protein
MRWSWDVSLTPRPLYPEGRNSSSHWTGGWVGPPRAGLDVSETTMIWDFILQGCEVVLFSEWLPTFRGNRTLSLGSDRAEPAVSLCRHSPQCLWITSAIGRCRTLWPQFICSCLLNTSSCCRKKERRDSHRKNWFQAIRFAQCQTSVLIPDIKKAQCINGWGRLQLCVYFALFVLGIKALVSCNCIHPAWNWSL